LPTIHFYIEEFQSMTFEQEQLFLQELAVLLKQKAATRRARKAPIPDSAFQEQQSAVTHRIPIPAGVRLDEFGRQRCSRTEFLLGSKHRV
jgi:hypothetical protein